MRRDLDEVTVPADVPSFWARFLRYVRSLDERSTLTTLPDGSAIVVSSGADGTLVPHGVRGRIPRAARAWPVGTAASTAVLTTGDIDTRYIRFYTTLTTAVNVEVLI